MSSEAGKRQLLEELYRSGAQFHGWSDDVFRNWQISEQALGLIVDRVGTGDRTLETGCGYSTVAFALAGARHTVISPVRVEHERIRAWCAAHDVSTEGVRFVVGHSQHELPRLGSEPLDFVLVDGSHAFPIPFIDWYYTAERVRLGGTVMVDDTHIRTGEILRDFLRADAQRWRLVHDLPTTAVFEKAGDGVIPGEGWCGQPYCQTLRPPHGSPLWSRARARVRLRTRLRAAAGRLAGGGRRGPEQDQADRSR